MVILHGLIKMFKLKLYLNHSFVLVVASVFYFDEGVLILSFILGDEEGMLETSLAFVAPGVLQTTSVAAAPSLPRSCATPAATPACPRHRLWLPSPPSFLCIVRPSSAVRACQSLQQ